MTNMREPAEKPKLRWYQYRLRHLFVLTAVAALICVCRASYWNWCMRPRIEYRRAVARIEERGGSILPCPCHDAMGVESVADERLGRLLLLQAKSG